jgi:streptogramin lyase
LTVSAESRIGIELAGYRIEAVVGRGGMGVVYRARDLALDRDVALKLLAPELAADRSFRERFLRESRLAASLEHPNVVPVHDAGEIDGQLYLAMRLVDGIDLKKLLVDGPLEPARAVRIAEQTAAALDAAHARGLVHRDVKPSNVLLDQDEHAYLADFGLTRTLGEAAAPLDAVRSLGTSDYVAPEQIRGDQVDGRADQYSLACVLHESLTGTPPFHRGTEVATLYAHLEEAPPAPPGLDDVMGRGLAKDSAERYPSCTDLVAAARSALGLEPRRTRWTYALAAAGLALLAAGLLAYFLSRGQGGTGAPGVPVGDGQVVRIDASTGKLKATIPFGKDLSDVDVGAGRVWVASLGSGSIGQIDPASGRLKKTISVARAGSGPSGIAAAGNLVWIVDAGDDLVRLYDAGSGQFASEEGSPTTSPAFGCDCPGDDRPAVATRQWFWTASPTQPALERFSQSDSGAASAPLPVGSIPVGVAASGHVVWVVTALTQPRLLAVDQVTNRTVGDVALPAGTVPSAVAAGTGAVWISDVAGDRVLRVEDMHVTKRIAVGTAPTDIAFGAGAVWVTNYLDGTISRIDPKTNAVDNIDVPAYPKRLAVGAGGVWVALDPP